eukprot:scaffold35452_cov48-Attheya_sp.AAC.1
MKRTFILFLLGCLGSTTGIFGTGEKDTDNTFLPANSCAATDDGESCIPRDETQNLQRDLIAWMRSNAAFVGHRQEVRLEDPQDPWSRYGVFATERIERGEELLSVPLELMIEGDSRHNPTGSLNCDTIHELFEEMKLGNESHVAPYVRYLKSIPERLLPEAWSDAGRELFEELLGKNLPPQPYQRKWHKQYVDSCDGGDDQFEKWMVHLVAHLEIEEGFMVPYLDFFNHRNGHWNNADGNLHASLGKNDFELAWYSSLTKYDETFKVQATRTIQPGEQIYTSVNSCDGCIELEEDSTRYGTADMLRDYGFVEDLPQRWSFKFEEEWKDIHLKEKINGSGDIEVSWGLGKNPPKNDVNELVDNVKHLEIFEKAHQRNTTGNIPENEWNIIWQYHDALKTANKAIITHMNSDDYNEDALHLDEEAIFHERTMGCLQDESYLHLAPFRTQEYEDKEESMFQTLSHSEHPEAKNKCFDLDKHIQICSDHRAHYHEPFVHFTTSFLKELKRVAFVGGGDNMILHEVLKYPSVEFVIGLELDQKCV